jgi:hypothetical protein
MFEPNPGAAKELSNAIYLENSGMELLGLKFWGSPIQPEFNNWAFNVARGAAIQPYWQMIPEGTDVLVTHGPPFGVLDKSFPSTSNLGCEELTKAVEQIRPRPNIFGHIHGGYGQMAANGTQFVNASVVDEANNQLRLAFDEESRGEAPQACGEGSVALSSPAWNRLPSRNRVHLQSTKRTVS